MTILKTPAMLRPKPRNGLLARSATCPIPYIEELRQRFQSQLCLLHAEAVSGSSNEERKPYEVVEGVALIHIAGVLTQEPYWWHETSYSEIRYEVGTAANDPEVKGILLNINSPGGETDGAFELADFLLEAGKKKRMWAVANSMAYSAAYLIASQSSKIFVMPKSGGVGSVGVYSLHADFSKMLEKEGVAITLVSAGEGKTDYTPYKPLSKGAKERLTTEIDRLYTEFVGAVARGRKMSEAQVKSLGAYCYYGAKASISSGLADAPGDLGEAWNQMVAINQSEAAVSPLNTGSFAQQIHHSVINLPSLEVVATASAVHEDVQDNNDNSNNQEVPMSTQANQTQATAADTTQPASPPVAKIYTQAELDAAIKLAAEQAAKTVMDAIAAKGQASTVDTTVAVTAPAPAATTATVTVAPVKQAASADDVMFLCQIARLPLATATELKNSGASIEEVRLKIAALTQAQDTGKEIHSHIDPTQVSSNTAAANNGQGKVTGASLIEACRKLAAKDNQKAA